MVVSSNCAIPFTLYMYTYFWTYIICLIKKETKDALWQEKWLHLWWMNSFWWTWSIGYYQSNYLCFLSHSMKGGTIGILTFLGKIAISPDCINIQIGRNKQHSKAKTSLIVTLIYVSCRNYFYIKWGHFFFAHFFGHPVFCEECMFAY